MRLTKYLGINTEKNKQIYKRIVMNDRLNQRVDDIRARFILHDENLTDIEFIRLLENTQLRTEAKKIIKEFGLPVTWIDLLHRYIIDSDFMQSVDPEGIRFVIQQEEGDPVNNEYYLRISPETSIKDIKDIWFLVQKEFKKLGYKKTRKKKSKNFDRDLEILSLKEKGFSPSKISEFLNTKYKKDLNLDHGLIKTIASKGKKIRKS